MTKTALATGEPFEDMTLGEATDLLNGPGLLCACVGGPYCCQRRYEAAQRLRRAAHIIAKLLTPELT